MWAPGTEAVSLEARPDVSAARRLLQGLHHGPASRPHTWRRRTPLFRRSSSARHQRASSRMSGSDAPSTLTNPSALARPRRARRLRGPCWQVALPRTGRRASSFSAARALPQPRQHGRFPLRSAPLRPSRPSARARSSSAAAAGAFPPRAPPLTETRRSRPVRAARVKLPKSTTSAARTN
jgi:hypothetical protein